MATTWERDDIQFPRMVAEIYATVLLTDEQRATLCDSMDLGWEDVEEIMERADRTWERIKAQTDREGYYGD